MCLLGPSALRRAHRNRKHRLGPPGAGTRRQRLGCGRGAGDHAEGGNRGADVIKGTW